jgi:hypothetical protein
MHRRLLFGLAALGLLSSPRAAHACAPAPPEGQHVDVSDEEALIVWDPAAGMEHFVRRARFRSSAADFGFLVPTPARPTLAEAPDAVFSSLARAIEPEVVMRKRWVLEPVPLLLWPVFFMRGAPPRAQPPAGAVRVLETKRVAGYDAAVLQADDARALLGWLRSHGYAARPELLEWLKPYVQRKWIVTAFRVAAGDEGPDEIATSAVRMSFETREPFFPYREPADQRGSPTPGRILRVFAVASARLAGRIGAGQAWAGRLLYASPRADLAKLLEGVAPLPLSTPAASWLLAWEDSSTPRPGTDDLFLSPAPDQARVVPPPVVVDNPQAIPIPVDVIAALVLGAWWLQRRSRRRAARA